MGHESVTAAFFELSLAPEELAVAWGLGLWGGGGEVFKSLREPSRMRRAPNNHPSSSSDSLFRNDAKQSSARACSLPRLSWQSWSQSSCSGQPAKRIKLQEDPAKRGGSTKAQLLFVYHNSESYLSKSPRCVAVNLPISSSVHYLYGLCLCGLWRLFSPYCCNSSEV